ncbi:TPA: hypothetical protein I9065_000932 [Clostridium perfringens]|uniref:helix-turn-helix domain-containing protein n=1 Tax=Clostridium perfringens TaxID=1502 RepID=UPI0018E47CBF|nr:helix-turn-helix domain-containing protein [Clostridium perfringens]MBI5984556.1 hypothetical protein [Clostridium perfringens]MDM0892504.1 hypothetical protein [Clostridium perfringens]HAT4254577.1 hypothetical protein [Clostridium perfringens]
MNQNAILFQEYRYKTLGGKYLWTIAEYTQDELLKLVGLSKSYINDLEAETQAHLTKANLLKLHGYLDKDLIMNDYFYFVLNKKLIFRRNSKKTFYLKI